MTCVLPSFGGMYFVESRPSSDCHFSQDSRTDAGTSSPIVSGKEFHLYGAGGKPTQDIKGFFDI